MELLLPKLIHLNEYINAERRNRFIAAKIKKEMTELVAWQCKAQKIRPMPKIEKITFIWQHKNRFSKDFDNVEFAKKWIMDGMVMAGVIQDDSPKFTPPRTLHKHEISTIDGCTVIFK